MGDSALLCQGQKHISESALQRLPGFISQTTMKGGPRRSYPVWYQLVKATNDKEQQDEMQSHMQQI